MTPSKYFFIYNHTQMAYGGPHGELGASLRYLSQRVSMPFRQVAGILNDIGTEECVHICWKCNYI
nr:MAG TPA: hypothetical protein [Caudoviricetes sp.]